MDGCAALWRSLKRQGIHLVRALAAFCSDGSATFPVLPKEFDLELRGSSVCAKCRFLPLLRQGMTMGGFKMQIYERDAVQ
jgi:hypothetical protein